MIAIRLPIAVALIAAGLAVGCSGLDIAAPTEEDLQSDKDQRLASYGKLFGDETFVFGGAKKREQAWSPIGVNSYLWRASLDTLSFMPLASADPFGGVIITDWYTPPESANERFKMTVYILTRELRADGLRVAVFRQLNNGNGAWLDAEVNSATRVGLEDAILTRARELRVASAAE